jgi:hypothetical protein
MRAARGTLALVLIATPAFAADSTSDLRQERSALAQEITAARAEQQKYPGGLLGSLITARLEVLKTNDAILQQRILADEGGARVDVVVVATKPDQQRADAAAKEMADLEKRIASQAAESAKYNGGLVKGMIESGIATTRLSLEMMRIEYLKAKYGIVWAPSLNQPASHVTKNATEGGTNAVTSTGSIGSVANELLVPTLSHKQYIPHDYRAGNVEDIVTFDIAWDTSKLSRPTRAIKGLMIFRDLFGEEKFRLNLTLDDPIKPGAKFNQKGLGFKYNQFMEEQQWVRSTDLKNMKVEFRAREILYADGSSDKF